MNSVEIQDKKSQLFARCEEIINTCKMEIRSMTDEEKAEFEGNKKEILNLNEELRKLQEELDSYSMQDVEEEENKTNNTRKTNKKMKKRFSLLKAINAVVNNRQFDEETLAVLDAGKREFDKSNISTAGVITLPSRETRTIAVTGNTAEHDDIIEIDMQSILTPNYANLVMSKAGMKVVNGAQGDLKFPIISKSSVGWEDELGTATSGDPTFSSVTITPRRLTAVISVSKQLIAQTESQGVEEAIMDSIRKAYEDKVEASILSDFSGDTKQPQGIFGAGDAETTLTDWASVCDFEATLEDADVNGEKVYICSPKAKAKLRAMDKGGKHTELVYENGEVDGTKVYTTSNVPAKKLLYGDFSNYVLAQFGGFELLVDQVTLAHQGQIRLVINGYLGFAPLRKTDYAIGKFA